MPSACHQPVTMDAHMLLFLCVWIIWKLVYTNMGSPSHSPTNTPYGFITNLITSKDMNKPSLGLCQRVKTSSMFSLLLSFGYSGKHHIATTSLLVLNLCGNTELNPGLKQKFVYPYGFCEQKVDFGKKAIWFDTCNIWVHKTCVSMSSFVYSGLNSKWKLVLLQMPLHKFWHFSLIWIGKTPVRIILWCPTTKMLIKACFLIQPPEQEGGCQTCCI